MTNRALLRRRLTVASILLIASTVYAPAIARDLNFEDRVNAQRAIEQVYWSHRIWPTDNATPRPALSAVMSDAAIRGKVEDYLKKSNALAEIWGRPITAAQLQAEVERFVAQTRAPEVLRELFAALGDDPFLIAETLARQSLADRLVRSAYVRDERFHRDARQEAERAVSDVARPEQLKALNGEYVETTFDTWWSKRSALESPVVALPSGDYAPVSVNTSVACVPDTWASIGGLAPTARFDHSSVWTGAEMIVWGGQDSNGVTNSGGRYNPSTDSWVSTSTAGAPLKRADHTAVWTGTRMVVWGGVDAVGGQYSTGGRYDPFTDSWSPTSTGSAPSARQSHTAVWTGSVMIVWGGLHNPNTHGLSDGKKYNPSTDVWSAMSTDVTAIGRYDHTAVWTGTEMIVWGGAYENTNAGGRYNPATDSWVAMSTTNAPYARYKHSAVWTGSKMIVWGGSVWVQPGMTNTGGLYDPATDTWLPTSISNAPSPRNGHVAVWTGSSMIVWGSQGLYTGGRYDPSADAWLATTTSGAPSGRSGLDPIWTGTEMIVWGGGAGNTQGDGARYCAGSCATPAIWYQDHDGDGFGTTSVTQASCVQPGGFVAAAGDCDDTDSLVWGAPIEVATLQLTGTRPTDLTWTDETAIAGPGTSYDLVSGTLDLSGGFVGLSSADCLQTGGAFSFTDMRTDPAADLGYWYLVRARHSCGTGTYGSQQRDSLVPACP